MKNNTSNKCLTGMFILFGILHSAAQPILDSANNVTLIGETQVYYIADSNASNLDAVSGPGTTWDYSDLWGYGTIAVNSIDSASLSAFASDYPNSVIEDDLGSTLLLFKTVGADSIESQGYVFNDPNYGTIRIILNDYLKLIEYPFTYLDSFSDAVSGNAHVAITTMPIPYYGGVTVVSDGYGTLLLGSNTYNNVLRIKVAELSVIDLGTGQVPVERFQYFYYDGINKFPLLMYNTITANGISQSAIYSIDSLPQPVSIAESVIQNFRLYPNPTSDKVHIISLKNKPIEMIILTDINGRLLGEYDNVQEFQTAPIGEPGTYLVGIKGNDFFETLLLVIQ